MTQRKPICIALCSPVMQSGKSTVAQHLHDAHGFVHLKFASGLKSMTRALLGELGYKDYEIHRFVEGDSREYVIPEIGVSTRRIMQTLGTEWGRDVIDVNLWARITTARAQKLMALGASVVIDDMRFQNEMQHVQKIGGFCYRIVRPDAPVPSSATHASEGELDGIAMPEIWNSADIPYLIDKMEALLHSL